MIQSAREAGIVLYVFSDFLFVCIGYKSDAPIHPYNTNKNNEHKGEQLDRPEWSTYGRMAEKTENVAFRRKFFDWPDPVDLKVKTVEAKVHAQVYIPYVVHFIRAFAVWKFSFHSK